MKQIIQCLKAFFFLTLLQLNVTNSFAQDQRLAEYQRSNKKQSPYSRLNRSTPNTPTGLLGKQLSKIERILFNQDQYSFSSRTFFSRIDSKQSSNSAEARLLSDINYGFELKYITSKFNYKDHYILLLEKHNFEDALGEIAKGSTLNLVRLKWLRESRQTQGYILQGGLGWLQTPYLLSNPSGELELRVGNQPGILIGLKKEIHGINTSVELNGAYLPNGFAETASLKEGFILELLTETSFKPYRGNAFKLSAWGRGEVLSSELTSQKVITVGVGLVMPFSNPLQRTHRKKSLP